MVAHRPADGERVSSDSHKIQSIDVEIGTGDGRRVGVTLWSDPPGTLFDELDELALELIEASGLADDGFVFGEH